MAGAQSLPGRNCYHSARSKVDLICQVNGANLEGIQGVLESMDKFFERFPVPSTLSLVNEGSVPVRFYNYSGQSVTIYKDTSVGSSVQP